MAWFKVDDQIRDHRKVRLLGRQRLPCLGLWLLASSWTSSNLTDGWIAREVVKTWDPKCRLADRLVEVGLWEEAEQNGEPGYQFHDWTDHQRSRAEVQKRREDTRRRVADWRARKAQEQPPPDDEPPTCNGSGNALRTPLVTPPREETDTDTDKENSSQDVRLQTGGARRSLDDLAGSAHSVQSHRLVEDYAATCTRRPTRKILNDLAGEVDALLAEDWPAADIERALQAWGTKPVGPRALQAVANEVINHRPAPRTSAPRDTADDKIARLQALKHDGDAPSPPARQLPRGSQR